MSLFDKNLADKQVKDPDDEYSEWEWWCDPALQYYPDYIYNKPYTKFANDKKQKQYRTYASRNINWKNGRIR